MGVIFSDAMIAARTSPLDDNKPVICWDNQVTSSNVAADEEVVAFPASNLGNPATNLLWKSGALVAQYVTVTLDGETPVDYLAIARHNLGSGLCPLSIEGLTAEPGAVYEEIIGETNLGDDGPAVFLFDTAYLIGIRIYLVPDAVEPQIAVLSTGLRLTMQKGVQPGHVPTPYARTIDALGGRSAAGDYLGTVIRKQSLSTGASFKALDPAWVRATLQPFLDVFRSPFFFAWRPAQYPAEVGYAWGLNDPQPVPSTFSGLVDVTMQIGAIVS